MLNTNKLLYILPDVAYLAELLPAKKPHSYSVASYRQINGKFLDDNEFINASVIKLLAKLDKDTYQLVLPDFLFTNTIVNIKEANETKVKEYIKDTLLPQLDLSHKTHQIHHSVLTEHRGTYKVQLSAIENSVLSVIKSAIKEYDLSIEKIYPLSWTSKSLISLEPSISLLQMGGRIYLAQHYIGIDQSNDASIEEVENLVETIRTLKGAEPSIQTVYLASNALVEEKLKDGLSDTLPLQQLVSLKDDDQQIPSYIKLLIESGMRTLSIPDYNLPEFNLNKVSADLDAKAIAQEASLEETSLKEEEFSEQEADATTTEELSAEGVELAEGLPKPNQLTNSALVAPTDAEDLSENDITDQPATTSVVESLDDQEEIEESAKDSVTQDNEDSSEALSATKEEPRKVDKQEPVQEKPIQEESVKEEVSEPVLPEIELSLPQSTVAKVADVASIDNFSMANSSLKEADVDLKQFVEDKQEPDDSNKIEPLAKKEASMMESPSKVIKNKDGVNSMLKTIFIFLASVGITVAIGIGLGLGFIKFTSKGNDNLPIADLPAQVETTPTPALSPTPTPEPEPEIDKAKYKILVVNATTVAGHAGKTKTALESAKFSNVKAGNAKGEYEAGLYVLLKEEDSAIVKLLSEASGLDLEFATGIEKEDPAGTYDAVIVLAK